MDEKKNKKNKRNEDIKRAKEEIEKLLEEAEEQLGVDRKNIKVIKLRLPDRSFKGFLIESLITLFLNVFLILGISGYLTWAKYSSLLDLLWFALSFSFIDIVLKGIVHFIFPSLIIRTLGTINLVPPMLAMFIVAIFTDFVMIVSNGYLILLFIILIILRSILKNAIDGMRR